MSAKGNEGIVNRGSISAQSIAVGRGARAVTRIDGAVAAMESAGHADVARALDELKAQLEAHAAQITDIDDALQALGVVAAGLAEPDPPRLTIRSVLDGLVDSLTSVAGAGQAAVTLRDAVGALL